MCQEPSRVSNEFDRRVDRFDTMWHSGTVPEIEDFLPPEDSSILDSSQRRRLLAELVMIDLEFRWRRSSGEQAGHVHEPSDAEAPPLDALPQRPRWEDYLRRYPQLEPLDELPVELIADEYRVRHRWGDRPSHDDYLNRFGRQARQLQTALRQIDAVLPQTSHSVGLEVRCPHCSDTIQLIGDATVTEVCCPSCGSSFSFLRDEPESGEPAKPIAVGRFELLQKLGSGTFGTVWKARDCELDRIVAVKIRRRFELDDTQAGQFLREARVVAQLNHPNIVGVHEVGHDGGTAFIVTDLVVGNSLSDWLRPRRPSFRETATLCAKIADALHHAHQAGVIHRDLKPQNIIVDTQGEPKLTDFGLARRETGEVTMTADGQLLGTPAYMSPEQAQGRAHQADGRTDVYSLGAILFQMLTGEMPFRGSVHMLMHQIIHDDAPHPCRLNGHVPRDLETICLKCLEKDVHQRYKTSRELGDDLRRFLRGQPVRARPISAAARTWRWLKRNPLPATLGTALVVSLVCGLAGVAALWLRARDEAEIHRRHLYLSDITVAQHAWEANDVKRCLKVLGRHRPRGRQADVRDFEWYYLRRLCRRSETTPTLQRGVTIGKSAFSPDGATLATTGGRTLELWDVATSKKLFTIEEAHQDLVIGVAFSPDGRMLATSSLDKTVKLWDLDGDKEPAILNEEISCQGLALAFSSDGKLLATNGPGNELLLWNVHNRSLIRELRGHDGVVLNTAFSPNGTILASGGMDKAVRLWDIHSGESEALPKKHEGAVFTVAFSTDGATLASGSQDKVINLWNVASREWKDSLEGHTSAVMAVAFSPRDSETLASASRDGTVRLWDIQTGHLLDTMKGHSHLVFHVAFSPDGRTLASDSKEAVKLWDLSVTPERDTIVGRRVAFSADGKILVSWTKDGRLKLWDTHRGQPTSGPTFKHPPGGCAILSPDGTQVATGTSQGKVLLCDLETDEERPLPGQHDEGVEFVMFSPSGKHLASVAGSELRLWNLANMELMANLEVDGAVSPAFTVAFSPDSTRLAIGCQDEPGKVYSVKLWDLLRKKLVTLDRCTSPIASSAFSLDGAMLASGHWDGEIKIWDVRTGTPLPYTIEGHVYPVSSVAFSPSGTRLASTSGDGTVKVWDVTTGDHTITLEGHPSRFSSVAFSPDGRTLVSADGEDTVKLWRAATVDEVRTSGR